MKALKVQGGFFALDTGGIWAGDSDELPEEWFNERKSGRVVKPNYGEFIPKKFLAAADGTLEAPNGATSSRQDGDSGACSTVAGWVPTSAISDVSALPCSL